MCARQYWLVILKVTYRSALPFSWCSHPCAHSFCHVTVFYACAYDLILHFLQCFSRASPICGIVSILPRVDLKENTKVDWFCISSLFRVVTLHQYKLGYLSSYTYCNSSALGGCSSTLSALSTPSGYATASYNIAADLPKSSKRLKAAVIYNNNILLGWQIM